MRLVFLGAAALALAGCGDGGADFNVKVRGSAPVIKQELAKIGDGSAGVDGLAPISLSAEGESLLFTIPASGDFDPGRIKMDFSEEAGITNVAVTVDLPAVPQGEDLVLSEEKFETGFRKAMKLWGRDYGKLGTSASLDSLEVNMAAAAIAAQGADPSNLFLSGGGDWAASTDNSWSDEQSGGESDWGSDGAADGYSASDGDWGEGS